MKVNDIKAIINAIPDRCSDYDVVFGLFTDEEAASNPHFELNRAYTNDETQQALILIRREEEENTNE